MTEKSAKIPASRTFVVRSALQGRIVATAGTTYCAVAILGTECYCDIFCNETAYDCCPDYWAHCHGVTRAPTLRPTTLPTPRTTRPEASKLTFSCIPISVPRCASPAKKTGMCAIKTKSLEFGETLSGILA
ncbi:hypothetical protein BaRGS_00025257 [Batillaria attramentaria]|uniref:SMB domain-containing protein n=1 Tax=Batillaria attramentaria TaxID=370345 RepID=A0ABD0K8R7_9CAEN